MLPSVKLTIVTVDDEVEYDTEEDLSLYLASYNYSLPKAKTEYVSIPGRTGDLDYTEALSNGVVHYSNGQLDLTFKTLSMADIDEFLLAGFSGKRCRLHFTNGLFSGREFSGRIFLENLQTAKRFGYVNFSVNVASVTAVRTVVEGTP